LPSIPGKSPKRSLLDKGNTICSKPCPHKYAQSTSYVNEIESCLVEERERKDRPPDDPSDESWPSPDFEFDRVGFMRSVEVNGA
jgi:hypothetical protein